MLGDESICGVLSAIFPTTCSGVRPLATCFCRSARVYTKNSGVMLVRKKLSNQSASSTLRHSSADLSKIIIGPGMRVLLLLCYNIKYSSQIKRPGVASTLGPLNSKSGGILLSHEGTP